MTLSLPLSAYTARLYSRLPLFGKWLLTMALIAALAHSMMRLFWLLMPAPTLAPIEPSPSLAFDSAPDLPPTVDVNALKNLALFDDPPKITPPPVKAAPTVSEEAKETVLKVELNGVFVSSNSAQAHAIIAQGNKQSLYRVGDNLTDLGGVKLVKVMSDRVIIDNNGKEEAILLYPKGEQISAPDTVHYEDTLKRAPNASSADKTLVRSLKSRRLTDVVKVSMARDNGAVIGFRVRPGRNRQAFEQLGLQTNDIVTAVNGVELIDSKVAMEVYRSMRSATQASIQINRGDQQLVFDINVADLEQ